MYQTKTNKTIEIMKTYLTINLLRKNLLLLGFNKHDDTFKNTFTIRYINDKYAWNVSFLGLFILFVWNQN